MFEEARQRPCGRPTKSGNPCRAQFSGPGFACKLHTTDHEKALLDAYRQGQRDGREQARRWEQQALRGLHTVAGPAPPRPNHPDPPSGGSP